ncbi:MAG: transporter substrate-binding domain-containing protein, partial [Thiobacillus sp.]
MLLAAATASAQQAAPQKPARENLTIDLTQAMQPWKGDLDAMIERRVIRVLTAYSKTFYFTDKGVQRGATYDAFRVFEEDLNKRLAEQQKLKQKHLKVRVVFIPIARGDLLQALADGKGDIAASNLTITPDRQKLVDFSMPVYTNVSEVVVSGPGAPTLQGVEDLSGKEVFVRKSSSYYQSLVALNQHLA